MRERRKAEEARFLKGELDWDLFCLARLFRRTVAELETSMSNQEFVRWKAFLAVERANQKLWDDTRAARAAVRRK